jgi:hypothetical protein
MAEAVVDLLEAVEIDEAQSEHVVAGASRQRGIETLHDGAAGEHPCQRVALGAVQQPGVGVDLVGDVAHEGQQRNHAPFLVAQRRQRPFHPDPPPVLANVLRLFYPVVDLSAQQTLIDRQSARTLLLGHPHSQAMRAQAFGLGVAQNGLGRTRPARDDEFGVALDHPPGQIVQRLFEQPVRAFERHRGGDVVVHIVRNGVNGLDAPAHAPLGKHLDARPAWRIEMPKQAQVIGLLARKTPLERGLRRSPGLIAVKLFERSAAQLVRISPRPAHIGRIEKGQPPVGVPAAYGQIDRFEQTSDFRHGGQSGQKLYPGHRGRVGLGLKGVAHGGRQVRCRDFQSAPGEPGQLG